MSKDQWIAEHEAIFEDLEGDEDSIALARLRLNDMGFDPHEIDEQIEEHMRDYR